MAQEIDYYILDRDVLAVAKTGAVGDWCAYVGSVYIEDGDVPTDQPINYKRLTQEEAVRIISKTGTRIRRDIAERMFPEFAKKYEWRA
jgi:hypothetical protein